MALCAETPAALLCQRDQGSDGKGLLEICFFFFFFPLFLSAFSITRRDRRDRYPIVKRQPTFFFFPSSPFFYGQGVSSRAMIDDHCSILRKTCDERSDASLCFSFFFSLLPLFVERATPWTHRTT